MNEKLRQQHKLKRQYKLKREYTYADLAAALDESAQAAVALRISQSDLVDRLLQRLRSIESPNNVVPFRTELQKPLYDPSAGP
jgi:hypothetical protein